MRKNIVLCTVLFLFSGCGTSSMTNISLLSQPIPAKQSRLIISRNDDLLFMAMSAAVSVNGTKIADFGRGGSTVYDIADGQNTISVSGFGCSGKHEATFKTKSGETYSFEVSPNTDDYWKRSTYNAAFGVLGDVVYAQTNENAGCFKITLKEIK